VISCCEEWLAVQLVVLFFLCEIEKKMRDLARKGLNETVKTRTKLLCSFSFFLVPCGTAIVEVINRCFRRQNFVWHKTHMFYGSNNDHQTTHFVFNTCKLYISVHVYHSYLEGIDVSSIVYDKSLTLTLSIDDSAYIQRQNIV